MRRGMVSAMLMAVVLLAATLPNASGDQDSVGVCYHTKDSVTWSYPGSISCDACNFKAAQPVCNDDYGGEEGTDVCSTDNIVTCYNSYYDNNAFCCYDFVCGNANGEACDSDDDCCSGVCENGDICADQSCDDVNCGAGYTCYISKAGEQGCCHEADNWRVCGENAIYDVCCNGNAGQACSVNTENEYSCV